MTNLSHTAAISANFVDSTNLEVRLRVSVNPIPTLTPTPNPNPNQEPLRLARPEESIAIGAAAHAEALQAAQYQTA